MRRNLIAIAVILTGFTFPSPTSAREPGWVGKVALPEPQRQIVEQTPIVNRPYRPLHFYGNTVRRMYYHGRPWPTPRELGAGMGAFVQGR